MNLWKSENAPSWSRFDRANVSHILFEKKRLWLHACVANFVYDKHFTKPFHKNSPSDLEQILRKNQGRSTSIFEKLWKNLFFLNNFLVFGVWVATALVTNLSYWSLFLSFIVKITVVWQRNGLSFCPGPSRPVHNTITALPPQIIISDIDNNTVSHYRWLLFSFLLLLLSFLPRIVRNRINMVLWRRFSVDKISFLPNEINQPCWLFNI